MFCHPALPRTGCLQRCMFLPGLKCGPCPLQNRNSLGQDPCLIVSILEAACQQQSKDLTHISLELSETSSSDLEYTLALLIQVRIISYRSTAQTLAMVLLSQTHQTSPVNATPSPTGAPPFISLLERDELTDLLNFATAHVQSLHVMHRLSGCSNILVRSNGS